MQGELRPAPGVLWRRFADRALVLLPGESSPMVLAGVAADVWRALVDGTTEADLVADLAARYDAGPATVSQDVAAFLADLEARRAICDPSRAP